MPKGTIRRLITDRGFGFIRTAEGADLFFHQSGIEGAEFEIGKGRDGRPQAVRVRLSQPKGE